MPRSKVLLGSSMVLAERANGSCYLRCTVTCSEKGSPILHVQLHPRCWLLDTESQSRKKPASSGPLIPSRAGKPAWLLRMQTWGWGRGAVFPSSISPGHTQAAEQRRPPAELRSCGCFSGVCRQCVSQGGSLERKSPLRPATALTRSPLSPCPRSHSVFCRWSHRFSPGVAGGMSLTLHEAPDKARRRLQPCRVALAIGRCSAETD